ncbi:AraC family transcriptional regulator [Streptosporangium sp. NPDC000396]|uniref:AraC family transcriptional regulator n=1 Tax=Streptosporangium sp. NPDC000396 TaxID=3366185 RepID=UPI0036A014F7
MPDLLGELLAPLRLQGVFFSRWSARAPWGVRSEDEHCAVLHYVVGGECQVLLPGGGSVVLRAGDLAVFPRGAAHALADAPGTPTVLLDQVIPDRKAGTHTVREITGPGAAVVFLCAGLHYDELGDSPLYRALPAMIILDRDMLRAEPLLDHTLRGLAAEGQDEEPGAGLVALRAFEMVFVLALRTALRNLDVPTARALRHPGVSRALFAMYTRYHESWTIESLAREAGMSRSVFSAAFHELVGDSPGRHLAGRRMSEAAHLLRHTSVPQATIPELVGYGTPVGFHLAFRRWSGMTPAEYRRTSRSEPQARHVPGRQDAGR